MRNRRAVFAVAVLFLTHASGWLTEGFSQVETDASDEVSDLIKALQDDQDESRWFREPATELKPEQEEAIAELKKLGCRFPKRPVVSLTLGDRVRGSRVTDADLVHLKGLPNLRELRFVATRVSNAGLVHLKELPGLQTLALMGRVGRKKQAGKGPADGEGEELTGKGLVHLKGLQSLRSLELCFIKIDGTDLDHLKALNSLESLLLCGSGSLTDAGVEHLKELTGLRVLVLHGGLLCPGPVLTDAGVEHLEALTGLRVLVLHTCNTNALPLKEMKPCESTTFL